MATQGTQWLNIIVSIEYKLSFWQAVKLRIAGAAYKEVAEEIMKKLKEDSNGPD